MKDLRWLIVGCFIAAVLLVVVLGVSSCGSIVEPPVYVAPQPAPVQQEATVTESTLPERYKVYIFASGLCVCIVVEDTKAIGVADNTFDLECSCD